MRFIQSYKFINALEIKHSCEEITVFDLTIIANEAASNAAIKITSSLYYRIGTNINIKYAILIQLNMNLYISKVFLIIKKNYI